MMASARSTGSLGGQLSMLYSLGAAGPLTDGQLLERFLTRSDPAASEAAFNALVDRHGAMVLGVCQKVLGDPHAAHDAFQATFLVLVSKAGSVRNRESVGGWLLGIARRVAARARVERARRRRHLEQFGAQREVFEDRPDGPTTAEFGSEADFGPLIAEVDRLPERFRAPVVLHYFEGLTTEATAQRLGCARGTVLSRLSRARGRIKARLEKQGVSFAALMPAGDALNRWLPPTPVPVGLAQTTVRAASSLALADAAIESVVPAAVAILSRGVARTLILSKIRAGAALLVLAVAGVSIGLAATLKPDEPRQEAAGPEMASPARSPLTKGDKPLSRPQFLDKITIFRGQVVDPEGKPIAGASILLDLRQHGSIEPPAPRQLGNSDGNGRFTVGIPASIIGQKDPAQANPFPGAALAAFSPGMGPDWVEIDAKKAAGELTLRLRRDDVPIEGRVINLEGRPIAGLTVNVAYIAEFSAGLLDKIRENAGKMNPSLWGEMRNVFIPGKGGPIPPGKTGPDGRFRISGIGRDRVVLLNVEGEPIEQSLAMVMTTPDSAYKPLLMPADGPAERRIEGPRFDLTAAPGRIFEGVVRDIDTRKPIADAKVVSWLGVTKTTDKDGRFLVQGQPRGRENFLEVHVEGQPYINVVQPVPDSSGLDPIHLDVALKRAVWVEGKVTDRTTGRPVKAVVHYYPLRDNPHLKECPDATFLDNNVSDEAVFPTDESGHFRAVALPGGGILTVTVNEPGYLAAPPLDLKVAGNVLHPANFEYQMHAYQALIPIDVPGGETLTIPEVSLVPGRSQHIQVVAPDGRPVLEARAWNIERSSLDGDPVANAELTFVHPNPGKDETIMIFHAALSLGAAIQVRGDEPDPIRVTLQPTGTISGRLVDDDGRPRPDVNLSLLQQFQRRGSSVSWERFDPAFTGPDGRFQIRNLVPELPYNLQVIKKGEMNYSLRAEGYLHKSDWTVKPGEIQDWGDVQVKVFRP